MQSHDALIRSLRRMARALTGSLSAGDAFVTEVLTATLRRRSLRALLGRMISKHRELVETLLKSPANRAGPADPLLNSR